MARAIVDAAVAGNLVYQPKEPIMHTLTKLPYAYDAWSRTSTPGPWRFTTRNTIKRTSTS